jgi:hypothetical protein
VLACASCAAGASLTRGCKKEDLKYMSEAFPEWFCGNLGTSYDSPLFDMHFLLKAGEHAFTLEDWLMMLDFFLK